LYFSYLFIAAGIHYTMGFQEEDIFYTPLPLYHTAGGIMCMGQSVLFGSTVSIRKKFSASNYFADCAKYNATVSEIYGLTKSLSNSAFVISRLVSTSVRWLATF